MEKHSPFISGVKLNDELSDRHKVLPYLNEVPPLAAWQV